MGREDYEKARRELELVRQGVRNLSSNTGGTTVARLYEFTQLVLNHPILSQMLQAIVNARPALSPDVRESWRSLHAAAIAPKLQLLAKALELLKAEFASLGPPRETDVDPYTTLRTRRLWREPEETFEAAFERLTGDGEAARLSLDQIRRLEWLIPQISTWVDYAVQRAHEEQSHCPNESKAVLFRAELARKLMTEVREMAITAMQDEDLLHEFANAHSMRQALDHIKTFDAAARRALEPTQTLPLTRPNPDAVLRNVEFISNQLLARLAHGPVQRHVLDRLRSYLEHFAFDDVIRKLEKEEVRARRDGGKAQREEILQDEIDRFVFIEGMFPITHNEASRGELDLLLDLYTHADQQRQIPLLIELKQELNVLTPKQVTEAKVRAAIGAALGQAERYRQHVCTHTHWTDVEPVVLMIHNCNRRLQLDQDNVFTIYLGTDTPSRRRRSTSS